MQPKCIFLALGYVEYSSYCSALSDILLFFSPNAPKDSYFQLFDHKRGVLFRESAVSTVHTVYIKYAWMDEVSVVKDFVYVILKDCIEEKNADVQVNFYIYFCSFPV